MEDNSRNVFWGLVIKPGKRYETEVQEPFRITKACIEPATAKDGKVTSVYVEQSDNNEEFIIANLNLKNFNESLDLTFNEGEKICFKIDGSGTVHLTGNLLDDPPPGDMFDMEDSEDDSEATGESEDETVEAGNKIKEVSDKEAAKILKRKKNQQAEEVKKKKAKVAENGDSTMDTTLGDLDDTDNFAEEEDSDDDDNDDSSDDEGDTTTESGKADTTAASDDDDDESDSDSDSEEEEKKPVKAKAKEETPKKEVKTKDVKTPKQDTPKSAKKENGKQEAKTPKQEAKTPKVKEETKTPKQESKTPKDAKTLKDPKTPKEDGKKPQPDTKTPGKTPKRTIKGGIQIEDLHEGSGQEVKTGNTVGMFYSGKQFNAIYIYPSQIKLAFSLGRLAANNKKFDSCLSGAPFKFKLGKGEVIKGWDLGVLGIKVGGKRRLTIPPKLAYGQNGAPPDIPPNSTLIFEIECKFAK